MAATPIQLTSTSQDTLLELLLAVPGSPSTSPDPSTQPMAAALVGGVKSSVGAILISGIDTTNPGAWESLTTPQQQLAISGLCTSLAAFMVEAGLGGGGVTQDIQVVIDIGGDTNTLHFVNGILTSVTSP